MRRSQKRESWCAWGEKPKPEREPSQNSNTIRCFCAHFPREAGVYLLLGWARANVHKAQHGGGRAFVTGPVRLALTCCVGLVLLANLSPLTPTTTQQRSANMTCQAGPPHHRAELKTYTVFPRGDYLQVRRHGRPTQKENMCVYICAAIILFCGSTIDCWVVCFFFPVGLFCLFLERNVTSPRRSSRRCPFLVVIVHRSTGLILFPGVTQ
jgi:hypothetical protein